MFFSVQSLGDIIRVGQWRGDMGGETVAVEGKRQRPRPVVVA